jgi:hypothetical protein
MRFREFFNQKDQVQSGPSLPDGMKPSIAAPMKPISSLVSAPKPAIAPPSASQVLLGKRPMDQRALPTKPTDFLPRAKSLF